MANQTLLSEIVATVDAGSWEANCIAQLNQSLSYDWTQGLVGENGNLLSSLTNDTWGITIGTCYHYCNANTIPYALDFNFQSFAASMTNYFLPWLALTAQLPFETGNPWSDIMSFCMAVGSPALITYSLTITILNQFWAQEQFKSLRKNAAEDGVVTRYTGFKDRITAALYLLREAQQVPLRASQVDGWLSSLIVLPSNRDWWRRLRRNLQSTRRGFTASLVAQMLLAAIAYLFTVIAAFEAQLGDPATALQIASGSLWIWLIPVILGWITVGTQYSDHSIDDALTQESADLARKPGDIAQDPPGADPILYERRPQRGLSVLGAMSSGLPAQPRQGANGTAAGVFDAPGPGHQKPLTWCGANVGGDEQLKGPIYNYARLFTWCQVASTIQRAFHDTLGNITNGRACRSIHQPAVQAGSMGQQVPNPPPTPPGGAPTGAIPLQPQGQWRRWDDRLRPQENNLVADSFGVAKYCGLDERRVTAYPSWSGDEDDDALGSAVYKRIIAASCTALFVQWGTTGASVLIAYMTPTVGIGCRSAGYLLYGGLGTLSWIFLLVSMLLSHAVMLKYQALHFKHPSMDLRKQARGAAHWTLCAAAVITRYIGKAITVLNTIWLILSSLLEFVGGYDNCWCKGNAIGLGSHGWVVLFKDSTDLALVAKSTWGGGFAMTLGVCIVSYAIFALTFMKGDDD